MGFVLLDLFSQAKAVERETAGMPLERKLEWMQPLGSLQKIATSFRDVYRFESRAGLAHIFFFDGDQLVFIGDHTTYTAGA